MENNDDFQKNLYPNLNYSSNFNSGANNINDPNVINYLNQPFLPQPYMPGQATQPYSNNINPPNAQPTQEFSCYGFQRNILYISNLPYNTNETDIKLFFKKYGDSVTLMTINPRHYNQSETAPISAKVIFKDPITANKARIEMNLRKLKGHAIRLMW
jgi:RNA recognition motif-containing protein